MLKNKDLKFLSIVGVLLVGIGAMGSVYASQIRTEIGVWKCGKEGVEQLQIECVFKMIEDEMEMSGTKEAMYVFSRAYERLYAFASTGCHRYAHRVGDVAYYEGYLTTKDLSKMDFPQETTACGYGFFHGFLEHLIQDHPSPEFVTQVCEHLDSELGDTMADIRIICYHGSGHGFTLAAVEQVPRAAWGEMRRFVDGPIAQCEKLERANENEVEECKQGVFNVIVDWMEDEQYGFAYDYERPFAKCDVLPAGYVNACYYEMAQKLDGASNRDPVLLADIAHQAITRDLAELAFRVGIAGVIQQTIADGIGYEATLGRCDELGDDFYAACIGSIVHGLFEHGSPQKEYEKALVFCADPFIRARGFEQECYSKTAGRLLRFYSQEHALEICREFPPDFYGLCEGAVQEINNP